MRSPARARGPGTPVLGAPGRPRSDLRTGSGPRPARAGLLAAAVLAAVLAGCSGPVGARTPAPSPAKSTASPPAATADAPGSAPEAGDAAPPSAAPVPAPTDAADPTAGLSPQQVAAARPVRLLIPRIGVDTPLVDLGVDADGALEVPTDFARAGWFTRSALPGARGPEVIAGHVDDADGPAVFYRLRDLGPGDTITVERGDGTPVVYRVDGVEQHPKDAFPTAAVYGPAPGPVLRLITCGGSFDRASGHYRDNTVVYATLSS